MKMCTIISGGKGRMEGEEEHYKKDCWEDFEKNVSLCFQLPIIRSSIKTYQVREKLPR